MQASPSSECLYGWPVGVAWSRGIAVRLSRKHRLSSAESHGILGGKFVSVSILALCVLVKPILAASEDWGPRPAEATEPPVRSALSIGRLQAFLDFYAATTLQ